MRNNNTYQYLKNLAILLVVLLIVLIPNTATAASNAVVSVSAPTDAIDAGEQFTISINVQPNNAVAGIQFDLRFNPAIVTVNSIAEGNLLKQHGASTYFNPGTINNSAGTITNVFGAIISPGETVTTAGTFAVITMTAKNAGGSSPLTLSNVVVGDIASQSLPVSIINGAINVTGQTPDTPPPGGDSGGGGVSGGGGGGGGGIGGGGGGGTSDIFNLRGLTSTDGQMLEDFVATDTNSKLELQILAGTIVNNKYGQVLTSLSMAPIEESQAANAGSIMIGQSYEIGPSGTTFDGSAILVFRFTNSEIPDDVPASNLYIALWDPDTMTWTDLGGTVDAEAGIVSVPVNHLSIYALMAHNLPANIIVMNFTLTPYEVIPGETVIASIDVKNQGDLSGNYEAILMLDEVAVQSKTVTISGGSSETLTFNIILDAVGDHQVRIGGLAGMFVVKQPPTPAAFTVNELKITPDSVNVGERASISILVKNTGGLAGTYQLTLSIDGIAVETREVTLDGGGSMTVGFNFTTHADGAHSISIGGLQGVLEVNSLSSPVEHDETDGLQLNSFSTNPSYDKITDMLVSVRIEYQMNESWASMPDARLVMTVFYDGEMLEQVPLFTLSQVKEDGITGELNYTPTGGWKTGEYTFQAGLYNGEELIQESLLHDFNVTSEATGKVFSWWTLGAVIGIASVLIAVLLAMIVYRRRDMLKY
jgi:hypothetical protein